MFKKLGKMGVAMKQGWDWLHTKPDDEGTLKAIKENIEHVKTGNNPYKIGNGMVQSTRFGSPWKRSQSSSYYIALFLHFLFFIPNIMFFLMIVFGFRYQVKPMENDDEEVREWLEK